MKEPARQGPTADVVIIGGGIIGLAVGWRAACRGLSVTIVDPDPGNGTAQVAAGMIAPVTEVTYTEEPLVALSRCSAQRYPDFVAQLEEAAGEQLGYRTEGTLKVAFDTDDLAMLEDLRRFQVSLGIKADRLSSRECRKLEPMLAPSVRGGVLATDDHSVNPRRIEHALLTAAERAGVTLKRSWATRLLLRGDSAAGVRCDDGVDVLGGSVVLAAGWRSSQLDGVPAEVVPPVRPVKGQIVRLWTPRPVITRTVRGLVRGSPIYVVPRIDGEIVLGATTEELGYDMRVTAGGVRELLRDGSDVLPGITELELTETRVGLRPGSPDNAPLLGPTGLPGLLTATGHYRGGVLLTPITADALAAMLTGADTPEVIAGFSPQRFTRGAQV